MSLAKSTIFMKHDIKLQSVGEPFIAGSTNSKIDSFEFRWRFHDSESLSNDGMDHFIVHENPSFDNLRSVPYFYPFPC